MEKCFYQVLVNRGFWWVRASLQYQENLDDFVLYDSLTTTLEHVISILKTFIVFASHARFLPDLNFCGNSEHNTTPH